jgi:hypothetical protein
VRGLPFLALLALFAHVSKAGAEEVGLPLDLDWSAPQECASGEQIRAELGRVARVRPGRSVPRLSARGRIEKVGDSYRLTLRTERSGESGERSLAAKDCRSLEREVTLVLAVAFGEGVELVEEDMHEAGSQPGAAPETSAERSPGAGGEAAVAAAAPKTATGAPHAAPGTTNTTASPERDATHDRERQHARIAVFAGGGVRFNTLPSPASLLVAGVELGWQRFWFEPRFVWLPPVSDTLERGVQARYHGYGGALVACHLVPPFSWSISGCLGWEGIALHGSSSGASESDSAVAPLFAAVLGLAWEWPARGFVSLRLEGQLHFAFNEPRFVVEGLGAVHEVPLLSPSLAATLAFFPGR